MHLEQVQNNRNSYSLFVHIVFHGVQCRQEGNGLFAVCDKLLSELNRRFDYMTEESGESFDSSFMTATALDPNLRLFVKGDMIAVVRRHLKKVMKEMVLYNGSLCFSFCVIEFTEIVGLLLRGRHRRSP